MGCGEVAILMVEMQQIEELGRQIGEEFHPERALLFGSYAYGEPTEDLDVDILVVMEHEGKPVHQSVAIRMRLRPRFPLDLLVRSFEKICQRLDMGDGFIQDILDHGKMLYEAPNA